MAKGRPADTTRAKRGTGHHKPPGDVVTIVRPQDPVAVLGTTPPADLPKSVHELWRIGAEELARSGNLREVDAANLKIWCMAVYAHDDAAAYVAKFGTMVKVDGVVKANPALRVMKDSAATARLYSERLGFDPLARIRAGLMKIAGRAVLGDMHNELAAAIVASIASGK